ncbi:hypothetical protein COX85_02470 [Candidatus Micrarchaeota archaeon CG_4_10_14_0_2_um_filter_55_9]|nr:MAG: hypothetical protein COT57_01705 [Candidatus Micrarchaeota archaeon CG09_land_8_20_14_0_10_55_25]PIZ91703.1 MAG: hypothetical protein COX85_02470 [Candidatus Micrarchaeota archaeon CG_4_10_14_0_2_um_filter_55_9]PJD01365.1 MAG: hypothetical protein COU38_01410 [Candidatus Micrarchaeota archaeon CG10_big_fil_rev_8_21_14_0_10_54_18]
MGRGLNRGRGGCQPAQDKNARGFGRGFGGGFGRRFQYEPAPQDEKAFLEEQRNLIDKRLKELN